MKTRSRRSGVRIFAVSVVLDKSSGAIRRMVGESQRPSALTPSAAAANEPTGKPWMAVSRPRVCSRHVRVLAFHGGGRGGEGGRERDGRARKGSQISRSRSERHLASPGTGRRVADRGLGRRGPCTEIDTGGLWLRRDEDSDHDCRAPTFGGTSFGAVGQYEKIRGTLTGLVDPSDPKNAVIADIANAPRNAQGLVQYTADFVILRPVDLAKGNHRVVYNVTNRGQHRFAALLNSAPPTNDPSTAARRRQRLPDASGVHVVAIGWDATVPAGNNALLATAPVATNPDGSAIVGPALEEFTTTTARRRRAL